MKSSTERTTKSRFKPTRLCATILAWAIVAASVPACAQECGSGYRVIAHRWDAVLRKSWEMRQDCAHPDWPARLVAVAFTGQNASSPVGLALPSLSPPKAEPLLVRAGDQVRLWMQSGSVHIEMSGVAEQSARNGEPVIVRITRQTDDSGLTVQRIPGTVRGPGDVEMER